MQKYLILLPLVTLTICGCQNTSNSSIDSFSSDYSSTESSEEESSSEAPEINPAIKVVDGKCEPNYRYSAAVTSTIENSNISRFTVYIETDYDTDLDGKNDLIKAYIQLPKEVLIQNYKIASIIQASPYTAATVDGEYEGFLTGEGLISDEQLKHSGTTREVTEEIDVLTHANSMDKNEFYYQVGDQHFYNEGEENNYFLVRGFAYINVGGYGTYGSEGIQTNGSRLETHAYASVLDWLNGKRVGFTDKNGTHTVKATFSNGSYAVQGTSYLGTTAYQLAASNIEGLKTICPIAGIASWYEYTNSQGTASISYANTPYLSYFCSSRILEKNVSDEFKNNYSSYLRYMAKEETEAFGDYSDYWLERDYTKNIHINCPALITQGLNDYNVKPKQAILMYQAFKEANQNVKLVFHQGSHMFLANGNYAYSIDEYKESFYEVLNRWYSHYLYDIDNGIENYPEITYQSNIDGKFYTSDNFSSFTDNVINLSNPSKEVVTSLGQKYYQTTFNDTYYDVDNDNAAVFDLGDVTENQIIRGIPRLDIKLKTSDINRDNLQVTAVLLDTNSESFQAYGTNKFETTYKINKDYRFNIMPGVPGTYLEFAPSKTKTKVISTCTFDLYNPGDAPLSGALPRTELEENVSYRYQVNFEPTIYEVAKGHRLKLVLMTFDPGAMAKAGEYGRQADYPYADKEDMSPFMKWSTTEPYSYSIDMTDGATLNLPF